MPIAEFHTGDTLRSREGLRDLGQDVLGEKFDPAKTVASLLANPDMEIGVALLTQSIITGLGNTNPNRAVTERARNFPPDFQFKIGNAWTRILFWL